MSGQDIGENMARQVETLRGALGDNVDLLEIASVVQSMLESLEGDLSVFDIRLQNELEQLVGYIDATKKELGSIGATEIPGAYIPAATDELDAVVGATETATESILEAAEALEGLSGRLDEDTAAELMTIATKIYEASNFQDVTGQRITKVVEILRTIEERVGSLAQSLGVDAGGGSAPDAEIGKESGEGQASTLLNGPQLPANAQTQDDIDALFDNLG